MKIGFSTGVKQRFMDLSANNPRPITLIGFVEGDIQEERWIHRLFSEERTHNEWFKLNEKINNWINEVITNGKLPEIPEITIRKSKYIQRDGISTGELRALAVEADCDPRTIDKYVRGLPVRGQVKIRIEECLKKRNAK